MFPPSNRVPPQSVQVHDPPPGSFCWGLSTVRLFWKALKKTPILTLSLVSFDLSTFISCCSGEQLTRVETPLYSITLTASQLIFCSLDFQNGIKTRVHWGILAPHTTQEHRSSLLNILIKSFSLKVRWRSRGETPKRSSIFISLTLMYPWCGLGGLRIMTLVLTISSENVHFDIYLNPVSNIIVTHVKLPTYYPAIKRLSKINVKN